MYLRRLDSSLLVILVVPVSKIYQRQLFHSAYIRSWLTRFPYRKHSGTRGCAGKPARKRRDVARAMEHHTLLAEQESAYEAASLTDRGFLVVLPSVHSMPPHSAVASSPPAAPPRPAVSGRAIRRLDLQMDDAQTLASTPLVDEADADFPSSFPAAASPDSCSSGSQRRLQEYEDHIRNSPYPAPPEAPRKDQHYSESESEAESSPWRPPAKVFRNGKLMYHKQFKGAVPITYVDTRLCEGGNDDYYEAHNSSDLRWVRRIRHLLDAHKIPRIPQL